MTTIKTIELIIVACFIPYVIFITVAIISVLISSIISMTVKQAYKMLVILWSLAFQGGKENEEN